MNVTAIARPGQAQTRARSRQARWRYRAPQSRCDHSPAPQPLAEGPSTFATWLTMSTQRPVGLRIALVRANSLPRRMRGSETIGRTIPRALASRQQAPRGADRCRGWGCVPDRCRLVHVGKLDGGRDAGDRSCGGLKRLRQPRSLPMWTATSARPPLGPAGEVRRAAWATRAF